MSQEKKKGVSQVLDLKYSVGIDISKDKFEVCISVINTEQWVKVVASRSFSNESKGFKDCLEWSERKCKGDLPVVFTMEATGIYYERLAFYLDKHQKYVSVLLPNKSKHYFQSLGLKSKNDSIDAQGLSRMGAEQRLSKWDCPDVSMMNLRSITRQRESLQETRTQINNQLLAYQCSEFAHQKVLQQLSKVLELLDQQIKETEGCIKEEISQDPDLKKKVERITQVKGLGIISVATVIAETNGFKMFANQRQLVCFAGYDVVDNQSGQHIGKTKISKKGCTHIRRILHMPAFSVVSNHEPVFESLYERVYERTKIKMKAYVAVQRKLFVLIYTLWKNETEYDRNYKNKPQITSGENTRCRAVV